MLLDPVSLEPAARAAELLRALDHDPRFKPELPAAQIEIVTAPRATAHQAAAELMSARSELARRAEGMVRAVGAGVSPLGPGSGAVTPLPRYQRTLREYGPVARRQLVAALQVHVAVPGAERALAVYNHARTYLPHVAALAANARFYEGRDSGLASVRPKLSELLPRQGIPPAFESWEQYADALRWGAAAGALSHPGSWWWELRPHPRLGTLEFRVPDTQATVGEAAAVTAMIQALVVWLGERYDAGEQLPVADTWRLEENRWSACRHGVEGHMSDPHSGEGRSTREQLRWLLDTLGDAAERMQTASGLEQAARMVEVNGSLGQRRAGKHGGARTVALWLAERFLEPWAG